jgi:hypothetical protein
LVEEKVAGGMKDFFGTLRKLIARIFNHKFVWSKAQDYELRASERWLKENFEGLYPRIQSAKAAGEYWPGPGSLVVSEFFAGRYEQWLEFAMDIKDKVVLELGAGPCGALAICWWIKRRIVIDPLILDYKQMSLRLFGKTWYTDDIELHALQGEHFIDELSCQIDGAIICRNTLDHCESPFRVLDNIAAYAKPGCQLLLWSDLYHPFRHGEGHSNITSDRNAFEQHISSLGFEILHSFQDVQRPTVNYGCRARKRVAVSGE